MNIYKANFETKEQGQDYLFSIGVLVETDEQIVFSKDTAAVVYIGKVVKIPATYDKEGKRTYTANLLSWICYRCNERSKAKT